jgi:hypothetical protein
LELKRDEVLQKTKEIDPSLNQGQSLLTKQGFDPIKGSNPLR